MSIQAEMTVHALCSAADDLQAMAQDERHAHAIILSRQAINEVRQKLSELEETAIATVNDHQMAAE